MKKRYILILGLIFALAISCVNAAENGTDIVKEQAGDLMGQNQQEIDNLSASSESEAVSVASENSSNNVDDGQILGMADGNETLAVPLTNDVLRILLLTGSLLPFSTLSSLICLYIPK